ncbi:hypothetical protein [Stieleria varia]|nr:hypothetical protein [Stieleria varia]
MNSSAIFEQLLSAGDDPERVLDQTVEYFRSQALPMELFEALKMQIRARLGLALNPTDNEPSRSEDIDRALESGLLNACRESGRMLIDQGRVLEGWTYLRPIGDMDEAREMFSKIEITDENYEEMIQVLLHEGVDIGRGFQAILDHQGTCNSITMFDQAVGQRGKTDQQAAAERLLLHFYNELIELVRADITERDKAPGPDESLYDMISTRKWVLEEGGYHLDTTHLSATVRIASVLNQRELIDKAWELTQYGKRLNHQFQYPGEEPFVDFYPAYAAFYGILRGENVEPGLKLFHRKATSVNAEQHGTGAIETYVDLLDRVGRHQEAIDAAIEMVPDDVPSARIVPLLLDIAGRAKKAGVENPYDAVLAYCQDHNDVLGYAAALHASK